MDYVNQEEPYAQGWRDYRRLRNRVLISILLFMLMPLLVPAYSVRILGFSIVPGLLLGFIMMAVAVFYIWQFFTWPCPQCGEVFGAPLAPLLRRCRNCGLVKWEVAPKGQQAP
jgi:hypothetical protein